MAMPYIKDSGEPMEKGSEEVHQYDLLAGEVCQFGEALTVHAITVDDIKEISYLTVELVRAAQEKDESVNVEEIGPKIFHSLLSALMMTRSGTIRIDGVKSGIGVDDGA